jgi:FkbM family methyltransferase
MNEVTETVFKAMKKISVCALQRDIFIENIPSSGENRFQRVFKAKIAQLLFSQSDRFQEIYDLLSDDLSKKIYLYDIEFHLLLAAFPRDVVRLLLDEQFFPHTTWERMHMDISTDIRSRGALSFSAAIQNFILDNYCISECRVAQGDVVFDIGAFDGVTSLKFASQAGSSGKVYAVEALRDNIKFIKNNINQRKISNVQIVEYAFYDRKTNLNITNSGACSALTTSDKSASPVQCIQIDDFVCENNIEKVDFIKMDIEGAELPALKGGAETIKRFRPKMAICIYHSGSDLVSIPFFIKKLDLGYSFYVRKYAPTHSETVLFCVPGSRPDAPVIPTEREKS